MPIKIKLQLLSNRVVRIQRYQVMLFLFGIFLAWSVVTVSFNSEINFHNNLFAKRKPRFIALTFDDGPHPQYTESLVRVLSGHGVKATFFLVGKMCLKYPELVKYLSDSGMEIGNHTFSHISLRELSREAVITEVEKTGDIISGVTGKNSSLFRPPGGYITPEIVETLYSRNQTIVMWTVNPGDYRMLAPETITEAVLREAADGGVILLHSGLYNTLTALPEILLKLKEKGYEIGTVSELNERRAMPGYDKMAAYIKMPPGTM